MVVLSLALFSIFMKPHLVLNGFFWVAAQFVARAGLGCCQCVWPILLIQVAGPDILLALGSGAGAGAGKVE